MGREIHIPADARRLEVRDTTCVPGFIDLHVHGAGGHDLMEGTAEAVAAVGRTLAARGTTAYFPTTLTASMPRTLAALESLGDLVRHMQSPPPQLVAQPLGIHMEGPFLNASRKGVHPAQHILAPTPELFENFYGVAGGALRILTLAPEAEGAEPVLRRALERSVLVGMGHTDATFEQAERAARVGRAARHPHVQCHAPVRASRPGCDCRNAAGPPPQRRADRRRRPCLGAGHPAAGSC